MEVDGEALGRASGQWKIKGWALKKALDKGRREARERRARGEALEEKRRGSTGADRRRGGKEEEGGVRPLLNDESTMAE